MRTSGEPRGRNFLPVGKGHLVDPDGEVVLFLVAVHLYGGIHLERVHVSRRIFLIERLHVAVECGGNEMRHRGGRPIELQRDVIPCGLLQLAGFSSVLPGINRGVGNLPGSCVLAARITFGKEVILLPIARIEDIELEPLRDRHIGDVKIKIENEVRCGCASLQALEPKMIRVRCRAGATKPELRRGSTHRRVSNVLR